MDMALCLIEIGNICNDSEAKPIKICYRKLGLTLLLLTLILYSRSACLVFAETEPPAASTIITANNAIIQAFKAVINTEQAGANVTDLIGQLNDAADLLAQAENSYRIGDYDTAALNADSALSIIQTVQTTAQTENEKALVASQNSFYSTVALAIVGSFAIILALFLIWRTFKRHYIAKLSQAKPEVVSS